MKAQKLHMIGNAHIDPVWLWQWQEGFHEVHATFRSALDRMEDVPEFRFCGQFGCVLRMGRAVRSCHVQRNSTAGEAGALGH